MTRKLIGVGAAVGAAMAVFGAGVAHADSDLTGMTYSEASSTIQSQGLTGRVSARVGDRLSQDECIVTGSIKSAQPARGFSSKGPSSVVLISLDCNGNVATATNPGYSAATPQGREAKRKAWLATEDGHAWCAQALIEHPEWGHVPGCTYD